MTFTESVLKLVEKMPNFNSEKARRIKISDIYSPKEIQDMKNGHFGIMPLVEILKLALVHFTLPTSFTFLAPTSPFKIDENMEFAVVADENLVYVGVDETNFAKLKIENEEHINHMFLTDDEKNKCELNARCIPDLRKLPRHKDNWLLASDNADKVDFRMREIEGNHNSNYGSFHLNLDKPEISVHLKNITTIDSLMLIEIASQQVATVLNEDGKTPVFKSIKVINPSRKFNFNRQLADDSTCDFRVTKDGKRDYKLQLAFAIGEDKFAVEILATQVPNRAVDSMIK